MTFDNRLFGNLCLIFAALGIVLLTLAACATPSEPRIVTREVTVPVPVPCKADLPPRDRFADQEVPLTSDIFVLTKAVLAGLVAREERLVKAEAVIEACGR